VLRDTDFIWYIPFKINIMMNTDGNKKGEKVKRSLFARLIILFILAGLFITCSNTPDKNNIPVYGYEVVRSYPHDPTAFTEGLSYWNGIMIEGTGLHGLSDLRKFELETGEIIQKLKLDDKYFCEGLTLFKNKIYQITEVENIGFIHNLDSLKEIGTYTYNTDGWGVTTDGKQLIMSDGSATIYFIDPDTFKLTRKIKVHANGDSVKNINEMEYIEGEIWANIWPIDTIVRISPQTGDVIGWINMKGLLSEEDKKNIGYSAIESQKSTFTIPYKEEACLNGIAYDSRGKRIFVTGKLWPKLFEIKIVPPDK